MPMLSAELVSDSPSSSPTPFLPRKRSQAPRAFQCGAVIGSILLAASIASARSGALDLRYRFPLGQTNVYHVELQVRGETGVESTSGSVFIVASEVGSNAFRLTYRTDLQNRRTQDGFNRGMFMPPVMSGRMMGPMSDRCQIRVDDRGRVLLDAEDQPLPIPFGTLMTALIEPLPESPSAKKWEISGDSAVIDYPYAFGPAAGFLSSQFGPPFYFNYGPRSVPAVLTVVRRAAYQVSSATADAVGIRKELALHSLLRNGDDPRCSAAVAGTLTFDPSAGMLREIELQGNSRASTEMASRDARVSLSCRLLEGADLAAAFVTVPVVSQAPVSAADVQKLMGDLASEDTNLRRAAANRLGNATIESVPPELLGLMASLATDADFSIRQSVSGFLKTYGTTNEVPLLIKLAESSDYMMQQNAIKGLARLKDDRAIEPLVDNIMRGSQPGQQEAATALMAMGPPAEAAVLQMFQEKNLETRRQACRILQQIGSTNSLDVLREQLTDPDQMLDQNAGEAIRAIKLRE
ncbi:MAG TPA: HEAT repeat domain-containing protein [Verrucomicrobiae bacterium]|nr:HEAT repeat domain-containing protein [Verrucomicrobiae bacterium]